MIDDTNKDVTDADVSEDNVTAEGNPAGLSINDLANMKQIIDVAAARGAFKTNEFQIIGTTCDRLGAFLESVAPAPAETADDTAADDTAADESAEG